MSQRGTGLQCDEWPWCTVEQDEILNAVGSQSDLVLCRCMGLRRKAVIEVEVVMRR